MAKKATKKSTKPKGIAFYSKKYGISSDKLRKVYKRGMGAYYSSGSRAGVSPQQWAMGRVYSFVMKQKGTWGKADKDLADKVRKKKIKGFIK